MSEAFRNHRALRLALQRVVADRFGSAHAFLHIAGFERRGAVRRAGESGPDAGVAVSLKLDPDLHLIASGGISGMKDIEALEEAGIPAVVFGKAFYEGRITLNEFVALTSTNHARMYGLYPKKGSIAPGFDADIVLWDPNRKETIRQELMHHGADYTPYEGIAVTGWPVATFLRGKLVAEEGKILGEPGDGAFLKRDLSPFAVPTGAAAPTV